MSEYEGRVTSQEAQAKRALAEAHEAGDYEKLADAQSAISQIAIEKERFRLQKNKSEQQAQNRCHNKHSHNNSHKPSTTA